MVSCYLLHMTETNLDVTKTRHITWSSRATATPGNGCGRDRVFPFPFPSDTPRPPGLDYIMGLKSTKSTLQDPSLAFRLSSKPELTLTIGEGTRELLSKPL